MGQGSNEHLDFGMDGAGDAHEHTGGTCTVAHLSDLAPGHSTPVLHVDPPSEMMAVARMCNRGAADVQDS